MISWQLFYNIYHRNSNCFEFLILWVVYLLEILNGTFCSNAAIITTLQYVIATLYYFRKSFEKHETMMDILFHHTNSCIKFEIQSCLYKQAALGKKHG